MGNSRLIVDVDSMKFLIIIFALLITLSTVNAVNDTVDISSLPQSVFFGEGEVKAVLQQPLLVISPVILEPSGLSPDAYEPYMFQMGDTYMYIFTFFQKGQFKLTDGKENMIIDIRDPIALEEERKVISELDRLIRENERLENKTEVLLNKNAILTNDITVQKGKILEQQDIIAKNITQWNCQTLTDAELEKVSDNILGGLISRLFFVIIPVGMLVGYIYVKSRSELPFFRNKKTS